MTTDVTTKQSNSLTIRELIEGNAFKAQIMKALPAHLKPDRFIRIALTAMTRTPKLAQCTQESLFKCLLDLSQLGIEPDGRRAHLIPFENRKAGTTECQLIVDYKGLVELVMRAGTVSNLHADVVCENDTFEFDRGAITAHKIDFRKPRGEVYAVYSICRFKDGTEKSEVMTREEVEGIRKRSKAGQSGPWVTDWNEMAKKTVFRRMSKWLTLSPEYRDMLEKDDDVMEEALPTGQWVPPVKKPESRAAEIFNGPAEPEQRPITQQDHDDDNIPMGDEPQAGQESNQPAAAGQQAPAESEDGPRQKLLEAWTSEPYSHTEGQLISVLRADGIIKQHEALEDIPNGKVSAMIKNIKGIHNRLIEMKGSK